MQQEQVILSWGSVWAQILLATISFTAPFVAAAFVGVMYKIFCHYGIRINDQYKQQLENHVVNGLNFASVILGTKLRADMPKEVRSEAFKIIYQYVLEHGAETIKGLGYRLDSPCLRESIQARISRAIVDPSLPTPPDLTPEDKKPDAVVSGTLKTTVE